MYEKQINIFSNTDRYLFARFFKYNLCFFILLLIIIFTLILWKKDCYYQNTIQFTDNKHALIIVDNDYVNIINKVKILKINNLECKYNIDKIEEKEKGYILSISFNNEINVNAQVYKVFLGKESLLKYIIRIIKGD